MYLHDNDIADFLTRAREQGLKRDAATGKSGLIIVKENVAPSKFILD